MVRQTETGLQLLVFRHPQAGVQLVKGSREPGETIPAGALRELAEETGIAGAVVRHSLGSGAGIVPGQLWHFALLDEVPLPDRWTFHTADDGGHVFDFFWFALEEEPGRTGTKASLGRCTIFAPCWPEPAGTIAWRGLGCPVFAKPFLGDEQPRKSHSWTRPCRSLRSVPHMSHTFSA